MCGDVARDRPQMWLCHADALTKSRHLSLWAEDLPGVQVLLPDQERYGQASGVMGMLMDNPARKPVVLRLAEVTLRLGEGPLAFEHANRPAIDAYWETATAQMPRLWNGPAFLFEDVSLEGGRLSGTGRTSRHFSTGATTAGRARSSTLPGHRCPCWPTAPCSASAWPRIRPMAARPIFPPALSMRTILSMARSI